MEPLTASLSTAWPFPFVPQEWERTPTAVQAYVHILQDELTRLREHVEALETRLKQNSTTSHRPPSSYSPYKKPRRSASSPTPRKVCGKPGHPGHRQLLLPPTSSRAVSAQGRVPAGALCGASRRGRNLLSS